MNLWNRMQEDKKNLLSKVNEAFSGAEKLYNENYEIWIKDEKLKDYFRDHKYKRLIKQIKIFTASSISIFLEELYDKNFTECKLSETFVKYIRNVKEYVFELSQIVMNYLTDEDIIKQITCLIKQQVNIIFRLSNTTKREGQKMKRLLKSSSKKYKEDMAILQINLEKDVSDLYSKIIDIYKKEEEDCKDSKDSKDSKDIKEGIYDEYIYNIQRTNDICELYNYTDKMIMSEIENENLNNFLKNVHSLFEVCAQSTQYKLISESKNINNIIKECKKLLIEVLNNK